MERTDPASEDVDSREETLLHPLEGHGLPGWSDELLSKRFQATGEGRFFEELVRRHRGTVLAACIRVLGNRSAAEDVAQEAFASAWHAMARFDGRNFRAWVHTIAYRLCVNEFQRSFRRYELPGDGETWMSAPGKDPDEQLRLEIEACLERLSPPQRVVLKLFYINGHSYEEIVNLTGYSEGAVKSYIQNGRRMFKKLWGEGADGE